MDIYFLEASVPLTKEYYLNDQGEIDSNSYPAVRDYTSHKEVITNAAQLHAAVTKHTKAGHCLLKGKLHRTLNKESRAGSTERHDTTQWMCLDLDGAPFTSPEEFMSSIPALKDVTYVIQYSASHGLGTKPGLRCHIYVLLTKEHNAEFLKAWLMGLNLDGDIADGVMRQSLRLTDSGSFLKWPLDITTCQNDKLIYIARPKIGPGIKYKDEPVQLVAKKLPAMPVERLRTDKIEAWKKEQRAVINALRKEAGIETLRSTIKWVGEYEVQPKPGEATITGIKEDRGFMYFNLNGGDSWGYFHPLDNFELMHNFKGEPSYYIKELLPHYYKECVSQARIDSTKPTEEGEVILGVCDMKSAAYWKIAYKPEDNTMLLFPARSEKQLNDWLIQHGKYEQEFVPQWTFEFNPQNNTIIDLDEQYLNTYVPSGYFRAGWDKKMTNIDKCPTIKNVLMSVVSNNEWTEVTDHLVNWIACIFQYRTKIQTAWLTSGTEGTGKKLLARNILAPLLGERYVVSLEQSNLKDGFNGWLEEALIVFVDEVQVSASGDKAKEISARLRSYITDSPLPIRNMQQGMYNAENYANFILSSNKDDPIDISHNDRRHNVGEFQGKRLIMTDDDINVKMVAELPLFFSYIMNYKADLDRARKIIQTNTRKDVIAANRNSIDMLADALHDGDISPFVDALPDLKMIVEMAGTDSTVAIAYHSIVMRELTGLLNGHKTKLGRGFEGKLTRDELWVIFEYTVGRIPRTPTKFSRMLAHKHLKIKPMRQGNNITRGIDVNWTASQQWCDEHRSLLPAQQPLKRVK